MLRGNVQKALQARRKMSRRGGWFAHTPRRFFRRVATPYGAIALSSGIQGDVGMAGWFDWFWRRGRIAAPAKKQRVRFASGFGGRNIRWEDVEGMYGWEDTIGGLFERALVIGDKYEALRRARRARRAVEAGQNVYPQAGGESPTVPMPAPKPVGINPTLLLLGGGVAVLLLTMRK